MKTISTNKTANCALRRPASTLLGANGHFRSRSRRDETRAGGDRIRMVAETWAKRRRSRECCGSPVRVHIHYHDEPPDEGVHRLLAHRARRVVIIVVAFAALFALAYGALWLMRGPPGKRVIRLRPVMRVERATGAQDSTLAGFGPAALEPGVLAAAPWSARPKAGAHAEPTALGVRHDATLPGQGWWHERRIDLG
jgi:hypothetical protein